VLAQTPHLGISSSGENLEFLAEALKPHNGPSTALDVPYLSAGSVLVQSNLVAILGRKLAQEFRRAYAIEIRELPIETPKLHNLIGWHRRFDEVPAHRWLRETIIAAAAAL
jgi:DNA-binding transcriptional LysR family regulator